MIDAILADALLEDMSCGNAWAKLFECVDATHRGEMVEEIVWSPEGDLSFVFTPIQKLQ